MPKSAYSNDPLKVSTTSDWSTFHVPIQTQPNSKTRDFAGTFSRRQGRPACSFILPKFIPSTDSQGVSHAAGVTTVTGAVSLSGEHIVRFYNWRVSSVPCLSVKPI